MTIIKKKTHLFLGFQRFLKTPSIFQVLLEDGFDSENIIIYTVHFIPRRPRKTSDALIHEIDENGQNT